MVTSFFKPRPRRLELGRCVPLGRRFDGRPLLLPWPFDHMLVSGVTGSGKSVTVSNIIHAVSGFGDVALCGVDLKWVELAPWEPRFARVADTHTEADRLVADLRRLADERKEHLRSIGKRNWDSAYGPWVVLVVDEAAEFFGFDTGAINDLLADEILGDAMAEKETAGAVKQLLGAATTSQKVRSANLATLARTARFVGIRLVLATQYPTAEVIDQQVRTQLDVSIMHRVARAEQVEVCLGKGWSATISPTSISSSERGGLWLMTPDAERPIRGRADLLTDAGIAERVAATRHLNWPDNDVFLPPAAA